MHVNKIKRLEKKRAAEEMAEMDARNKITEDMVTCCILYCLFFH
jgi:hypothetical protein